MEKKTNIHHHYFYTIYYYENLLRSFWYGVIKMFAHWPSLMIHVFTRKNMGERYYTLAAPITFIIILLQPFFFKKELRFLGEVADYFNWFSIVFLTVFLGFAIKRRLEIKRTTHEFDEERFSKYEGEHPLYNWTLEKFKDNEAATRLLKKHFIKTRFESFLAILAGLVLIIFPFSFLVGLLLFVSGLLDMARTHVQYSKGRHFVLDHYDNLIVTQEFKDAFVNNKPPEQSNLLDLSTLPRSKNRKVNEKLADIINAQSAQSGTAQPESE